MTIIRNTKNYIHTEDEHKTVCRRSRSAHTPILTPWMKNYISSGKRSISRTVFKDFIEAACLKLCSLFPDCRTLVRTHTQKKCKEKVNYHKPNLRKWFQITDVGEAKLCLHSLANLHVIQWYKTCIYTWIETKKDFVVYSVLSRTKLNTQNCPQV